jgi:hypothetical protein
MRFRLVAAFLAVCLVAAGQTMSLDKLVAFIQSSQGFIKEGKMTDRALADYLGKVNLTQRLDDRTIEELQGMGELGPKTLEALHALRDRTANLAAGAPVKPPSGYVQPPPPSSQEQAAIISEVRKYALDFSKNLPDFICTQVTRRFASPVPRVRRGSTIDEQPSWRALDTLTIRLSYFGQKEDYKLIMVNNTVTTQDYHEVGGATSTGDFGSMMKDIFEPGTEARFEWDHWGTLRERLTMVFAYRVAQSHSQWHILYERSQDIVPAYRGLVYIDKETHEITRVTLMAENIPSGFPVSRAETILDYGYTDISGRTFLLPLKGQVIMSADDYLTKNDTEFRLYRKYSAESEIKFETETPAPLPEEKTEETPLVKQPVPAKKKK